MKTPLVSIITPCFNSARFIEDCIESVLAQDYPYIEHIIQDGASKDGTVDILRRYEGRIDWVSEPDHGQSEGLDRALKRSHGDILFVLNADDMLLPDAASWAVKQMALFPDEAVIYGDLRLMDEQGEITGEFHGPEYDFPSVLSVQRVIPAQAAFIRRYALDQVGLGADLTLDTCPDYEMFVRLGLKFSMRHVPGFVANYRYYFRSMDGATPRSVDRFIRAKYIVMQRVFQNSETPPEIRKLERRAKAGLYLWAVEEARGIKQLRAAWLYYAQAISEMSVFGRILAFGIRAYVSLKPKRYPKPKRISQNPSTVRAIYVGAGLVQTTPEINRLIFLSMAISNFIRRLFLAMKKMLRVLADWSIILVKLVLGLLTLAFVIYVILLLQR